MSKLKNKISNSTELKNFDTVHTGRAFKKKIGIICIVVAVVLVILSLTYAIQINQKTKLEEVKDLKEEETLTGIINGDKAIVTSSTVAQVKTGTGPFDEDDEAGNDSSEDNYVVRSFDQITWTINNTMQMKNITTETSAKGGYLNIEATIRKRI